MSARQVALPVAVVTCVAGAFRILQSFAPVLLDSRISLGLSAFVFAGTFVSFLLNPGVVLAIAYRASDTVDIPREWSSIAAWAFVAAVVGYLVGGSLGSVSSRSSETSHRRAASASSSTSGSRHSSVASGPH